MIVFWLSLICLFAAALPALVFFANLRHFKPPPPVPQGPAPRISVLVPARNEEGSIAACVRSVLESSNVELEVIVLDDHSTDATAEIVQTIASADPRVRLETAPELPPGWCGKQHACHVLSTLATHEMMTFLDADVRLQPEALARMAAFLDASKAGLVSGFPRQETGTFLERLLIPLIHWTLLCFLPFGRMRQDLRTSLGAGCGQWFMTTKSAYQKAGGHAAIKESLHDGVKLPRAYRTAGIMTDLCDVTDLATCRMYRTNSQVWFGLAKNAREGLGGPKLLPFFTVLFLLGHVLPFILLLREFSRQPNGFGLNNTVVAITCGLALLPRILAAPTYRQSLLSALLHPFGILTLLAIQWYANVRYWLGRPVGWKGRPPPRLSSENPNPTS
jgi:glycosyltransferase involved in cell wall biosynthesis